MPYKPQWRIPPNIEQIVEENDGTWECRDWLPIQLSVLSNTTFDGRDIPLAWEIEFDPTDDDFVAASEAIEQSGLEPDGYGWAEFVRRTFDKRGMELARTMNAGDSEMSTCVIWVESESECRAIVELLWGVLHDA